MFATIEKGSKFCFAGHGNDMLDDEGDGKDGSFVKIQVAFVGEVEMCCGSIFCNWLGQKEGIGVQARIMSLTRNQTVA